MQNMRKVFGLFILLAFVSFGLSGWDVYNIDQGRLGRLLFLHSVIIVSMIYLIFKLIRSKQKSACKIIAIAVFLGVIAAMFVRDAKLKEAKKRAQSYGDFICLKIDNYRQTHGNLPATLLDLVPLYIKQIPSTPFKNGHYIYKVENTEYYSLSFESYAGLNCRKESNVGRWICSD